MRRSELLPLGKNLVIDAETAYGIAYEAMIKGFLALMLSHGKRPRKELGHHIAIIEFARKDLPGCPATTFILFERMRSKLNDAFYDVTIILRTEVLTLVMKAPMPRVTHLFDDAPARPGTIASRLYLNCTRFGRLQCYERQSRSGSLLILVSHFHPIDVNAGQFGRERLVVASSFARSFPVLFFVHFVVYILTH